MNNPSGEYYDDFNMNIVNNMNHQEDAIHLTNDLRRQYSVGGVYQADLSFGPPQLPVHHPHHPHHHHHHNGSYLPTVVPQQQPFLIVSDDNINNDDDDHDDDSSNQGGGNNNHPTANFLDHRVEEQRHHHHHPPSRPMLPPNFSNSAAVGYQQERVFQLQRDSNSGHYYQHHQLHHQQHVSFQDHHGSPQNAFSRSSPYSRPTAASFVPHHPHQHHHHHHPHQHHTRHQAQPTTIVSTEPTTIVSTEPTTIVSTEPTTIVSTEPTISCGGYEDSESVNAPFNNTSDNFTTAAVGVPKNAFSTPPGVDISAGQDHHLQGSNCPPHRQHCLSPPGEETAGRLRSDDLLPIPMDMIDATVPDGFREMAADELCPRRRGRPCRTRRASGDIARRRRERKLWEAIPEDLVAALEASCLPEAHERGLDSRSSSGLMSGGGGGGASSWHQPQSPKLQGTLDSGGEIWGGWFARSDHGGGNSEDMTAASSALLPTGSDISKTGRSSEKIRCGRGSMMMGGFVAGSSSGSSRVAGGSYSVGNASSSCGVGDPFRGEGDGEGNWRRMMTVPHGGGQLKGAPGGQVRRLGVCGIGKHQALSPDFYADFADKRSDTEGSGSPRSGAFEGIRARRRESNDEYEQVFPRLARMILNSTRAPDGSPDVDESRRGREASENGDCDEELEHEDDEEQTLVDAAEIGGKGKVLWLGRDGGGGGGGEQVLNYGGAQRHQLADDEDDELLLVGGGKGRYGGSDGRRLLDDGGSGDRAASTTSPTWNRSGRSRRDGGGADQHQVNGLPSVLPPRGFHCGAAGRVALRRFFEASVANRVSGPQTLAIWRECKGLKHQLAIALLDFLKAMGRSRNNSCSELLELLVAQELKYSIAKQLVKAPMRLRNLSLRSLPAVDCPELHEALLTVLGQFSGQQKLPPEVLAGYCWLPAVFGGPDIALLTPRRQRRRQRRTGSPLASVASAASGKAARTADPLFEDDCTGGYGQVKYRQHHVPRFAEAGSQTTLRTGELRHDVAKQRRRGTVVTYGGAVDVSEREENLRKFFGGARVPQWLKRQVYSVRVDWLLRELVEAKKFMIAVDELCVLANDTRYDIGRVSTKKTKSDWRKSWTTLHELLEFVSDSPVAYRLIVAIIEEAYRQSCGLSSAFDFVSSPLPPSLDVLAARRARGAAHSPDDTRRHRGLPLNPQQHISHPTPSVDHAATTSSSFAVSICKSPQNVHHHDPIKQLHPHHHVQHPQRTSSSSAVSDINRSLHGGARSHSPDSSPRQHSRQDPSSLESSLSLADGSLVGQKTTANEDRLPHSAADDTQHQPLSTASTGELPNPPHHHHHLQPSDVSAKGAAPVGSSHPQQPPPAHHSAPSAVCLPLPGNSHLATLRLQLGLTIHEKATTGWNADFDSQSSTLALVSRLIGEGCLSARFELSVSQLTHKTIQTPQELFEICFALSAAQVQAVLLQGLMECLMPAAIPSTSSRRISIFIGLLSLSLSAPVVAKHLNRFSRPLSLRVCQLFNPHIFDSFSDVAPSGPSPAALSIALARRRSALVTSSPLTSPASSDAQPPSTSAAAAFPSPRSFSGGGQLSDARDTAADFSSASNVEKSSRQRQQDQPNQSSQIISSSVNSLANGFGTSADSGSLFEGFSFPSSGRPITTTTATDSPVPPAGSSRHHGTLNITKARRKSATGLLPDDSTLTRAFEAADAMILSKATTGVSCLTSTTTANAASSPSGSTPAYRSGLPGGSPAQSPLPFALRTAHMTLEPFSAAAQGMLSPYGIRQSSMLPDRSAPSIGSAGSGFHSTPVGFDLPTAQQATEGAGLLPPTTSARPQYQQPLASRQDAAIRDTSASSDFDALHTFEQHHGNAIHGSPCGHFQIVNPSSANHLTTQHHHRDLHSSQQQQSAAAHNAQSGAVAANEVPSRKRSASLATFSPTSAGDFRSGHATAIGRQQYLLHHHTEPYADCSADSSDPHGRNQSVAVMMDEHASGGRTKRQRRLSRAPLRSPTAMLSPAAASGSSARVSSVRMPASMGAHGGRPQPTIQPQKVEALCAYIMGEPYRGGSQAGGTSASAATPPAGGGSGGAFWGIQPPQSPVLPRGGRPFEVSKGGSAGCSTRQYESLFDFLPAAVDRRVMTSFVRNLEKLFAFNYEQQSAADLKALCAPLHHTVKAFATKATVSLNPPVSNTPTVDGHAAPPPPSSANCFPGCGTQSVECGDSTFAAGYLGSPFQPTPNASQRQVLPFALAGPHDTALSPAMLFMACFQHIQNVAETTDNGTCNHDDEDDERGDGALEEGKETPIAEEGQKFRNRPKALHVNPTSRHHHRHHHHHRHRHHHHHDDQHLPDSALFAAATERSASPAAVPPLAAAPLAGPFSSSGCSTPSDPPTTFRHDFRTISPPAATGASADDMPTSSSSSAADPHHPDTLHHYQSARCIPREVDAIPLSLGVLRMLFVGILHAGLRCNMQHVVEYVVTQMEALRTLLPSYDYPHFCFLKGIVESLNDKSVRVRLSYKLCRRMLRLLLGAEEALPHYRWPNSHRQLALRFLKSRVVLSALASHELADFVALMRADAAQVSGEVGVRWRQTLEEEFVKIILPKHPQQPTATSSCQPSNVPTREE